MIRRPPRSPLFPSTTLFRSDLLRAPRGVDPGVARAEERQAELELEPAGALAAQVGEGVAPARIEERDGAGGAALQDGGIGIAQVEVVDVLAELPLQLAALRLAEQV